MPIFVAKLQYLKMTQFKSPKGHSGWLQLVILLALVLGGFILAGVVQIGFYKAMGVKDLVNKAEIMAQTMNPKNAQILQWMQFVSFFLMLFIPSLLFLRISYGKRLFWGGSNKHFNGKQIALAFFIILTTSYFAQPLQTVTESVLKFLPKLNAMSKELENDYNSLVTALSNLSGVGSYLLGLIILALLPAVFEELFFRGVIQTLFVKWWRKPILAILVTSVIFSMVHLSILLFLPRLVLGYILGLLFYLSKNIWVNIAAHFINNALALSVMFFSKQSLEQVAKTEKGLPVWSMFISLTVLGVMLHYFIKASRNKVSAINEQELKLLSENFSN